MLESRQFHILWDVTPGKIDEKEFQKILREHVGDKPYEIDWIQLYIKQETQLGDLCLFLLQKNQTGCHVDPEKGKLDSKAGVIFYKEVQKTVESSLFHGVFQGHNFQMVYPKPIQFSKDDSLNLNLKASNSAWRRRTVEFLWTISYEVIAKRR